MTKHLIVLVAGALSFAIGLADFVADSRISPYITLLGGLGLGALAVYRIQKRGPKS